MGPPIYLSSFAKGDGDTDDTQAIIDWAAAIKGVCGWWDRPSEFYKTSACIPFVQHFGTRILCDPYANMQMIGPTSGATITYQDCVDCDIDSPMINSPGGASGIIVSSTTSYAAYNRWGSVRLTNSGGPSPTKPSDPLGGSVGFQIQGPPGVKANFYNHLKSGTKIMGFDCGIAASEVDGGGIMNANANTFIFPHVENFWYGFYTNCTENILEGAQFHTGNAHTTPEMYMECVRVGDGTLATVRNKISLTAEPEGYSRPYVCMSNSHSNRIVSMSNCSLGGLDYGKNDIYDSTNGFVLNSSAQFLNPANWIPNQPISDPHNGGMIWNSGGAAMLSAG